jgi:hypothetical protein
MEITKLDNNTVQITTSVVTTIDIGQIKKNIESYQKSIGAFTELLNKSQSLLDQAIALGIVAKEELPSPPLGDAVVDPGIMIK